MGRALRNEEPGGTYHVTSRGSDRRAISVDDWDRFIFVRMLDRVSVKHRWVGYAWCLMTNHFHLVVQVPHGGLSSGMRELNGGYSRTTNGRHGRVVHLFENRFASKLIQTDGHLLESCRYVLLNPVRAELCTHPADWKWSSYRACAGTELATKFLARDELLRLFASDPECAKAAFRSFVAEGHVSVSDTVTKRARNAH